MKLNVPASAEALSLCIEQPYFIFEWAGLLPESTYRQLLAEFPGKDGKGYKAQEAGKLFVNDRQGSFNDIISNSPVWTEFYQAWKNQAVIDRIQALVRDHIKHRPAAEQRRWHLVNSTDRHPSNLWERIVKKFYEKILGRKTVRLGFEFSVLPDGAAVPLHTDAAFKLVSMLYYFPDDDWQASYGGGTCFYQVKPGLKPWTLWKSYYLEAEQEARFRQEHDVVVETTFSPNKISGFVKTDHSWHEVKPLQLPPGKLRRSLCINIFAW